LALTLVGGKAAPPLPQNLKSVAAGTPFNLVAWSPIAPLTLQNRNRRPTNGKISAPTFCSRAAIETGFHLLGSDEERPERRCVSRAFNQTSLAIAAFCPRRPRFVAHSGRKP